MDIRAIILKRKQMKTKLLILILSISISNSVYSQLVSITIIPVNPILPQNIQSNLRAIGIYLDGHTANITSSCIWSSNNIPATQAYSSGQAYPFGVGTAFGGEIITANTGLPIITAAFGPINGNTIVTVSTDIDGDGVLNNIDNCLFVANPTQQDDDADLIGNSCDCSILSPNPGIPTFNNITIYAFPGNSITIGQTVTFYSTITTNGVSPLNYQWTKNSLPVGTNSPEYIENGIVNGDIINCNVSDSASCILNGTSNSITFAVSALSVKEYKEENSLIKIFPNPTSNILNIQSNSKIKLIELIDTNGRIIKNFHQDSKNANINLEKMTKGIYFVRISSESGTSIQKVIRK